MKHITRIAAILIFLGLFFTGCQTNKLPEKTPGVVTKNDISKPGSLKWEVQPYLPQNTGEVHHAIAGARRFIIPGCKDARIAEMKFLGNDQLLIAAWQDGTFQQLDYYVYSPKDQSFLRLPKNMQYLKTLDDGRIFASVIQSGNKAENEYVILNRDNLEVQRKITVPSDVAWGTNDLDISPDGKRMVFWTVKPRENIYIGNLDFSERRLLVNAEYKSVAPLIKAVGFVPGKPRFIDINNVIYTTEHRFKGYQNAIVNITTIKISRYQSYKDITMYDTLANNAFFMDNQSWYFGTVSKSDDKMKIIKDFRNTSERISSYNYTKNGKYAAVATIVDDKYSYIYVADLISGEVTKLDPGERLYMNADAWSPSVSEDGKWLVFCDRAKGEQQMNGYVLSLR